MKADVLALLRESPGAWLSVAQMERELPRYSVGQIRAAVRRRQQARDWRHRHAMASVHEYQVRQAMTEAVGRLDTAIASATALVAERDALAARVAALEGALREALDSDVYSGIVQGELADLGIPDCLWNGTPVREFLNGCSRDILRQIDAHLAAAQRAADGLPPCERCAGTGLVIDGPVTRPCPVCAPAAPDAGEGTP